jgi:hypothetical protein
VSEPVLPPPPRPVDARWAARMRPDRAAGVVLPAVLALAGMGFALASSLVPGPRGLGFALGALAGAALLGALAVRRSQARFLAALEDLIARGLEREADVEGDALDAESDGPTWRCLEYAFDLDGRRVRSRDRVLEGAACEESEAAGRRRVRILVDPDRPERTIVIPRAPAVAGG